MSLPVSAAAVQIGPNQSFQGLVNGRSGPVGVRMACFGAVRPGQTGHPMAGQTVTVSPAVAVSGSFGGSIGFTGSKANSIVVVFGPLASSATNTLTFTSYGTMPVPTSFVLPCFGSGSVTFVPKPTSPTARSASVSVSYVGQP